MKTDKLLKLLAKQFPKRYAAVYHDYVGLMCGKKPDEVKRIVLCLDFDYTIEKEAFDFHPDLIITHHPFIYGRKKNVFKYEPRKKELFDHIVEHNIALYSYHTNFDAGKGGMNDALTSALGLNNVYTPEEDISMRIGELESAMDINDFVSYAKDKLNVGYGLLINAGNKKVKKVGIIGGGGSYEYVIAQKHNCDIYISGDAPHHKRRDMVLDKMNYLDVPHEVERIFMPTMKNILLGFDPTLEIKIIDHEKTPKVI